LLLLELDTSRLVLIGTEPFTPRGCWNWTLQALWLLERLQQWRNSGQGGKHTSSSHSDLGIPRAPVLFCHEQSAGGTKNTPGTGLKHPAGGTCNTAAHYGGSAPRPLCPPSLYIAFALLGLLVVPGCPSLPCMLVMPSAPCAVTACQPFLASTSPSRLPSRPGTSAPPQS